MDKYVVERRSIKKRVKADIKRFNYCEFRGGGKTYSDYVTIKETAYHLVDDGVSIGKFARKFDAEHIAQVMNEFNDFG